MKIAVIYDTFREDTLGEYYRRALMRAGHEVTHYALKTAGDIPAGFDLYFRVDDGEYRFDIPHDKLRPAFFYASDVHLSKPYAKIRRLAPLYDKVFCAQYDGQMKLERAFPGKTAWLPHAADSYVHVDLHLRRDLDIGFVGNDGGVPRKFLLQELRERFPNAFIGNAPHTDIAKIYSRSKIVFNYSINNDINMRMYEALVGGALLLTNAIRGNGFERIFSDRKDLVVYKNPAEIFLLLEYYLGHEQERQAIAAAGQERALAGGTYDQRVKEVLRYAPV